MYDYRLDSLGRYIQSLGGHDIYMMDEVAFLFDRRQQCLLSHGPKDLVRYGYNEKYRKRMLSGFRELAGDLTYFEGKFPIVEINRIVISIDYVVEFYYQMYPALIDNLRPITKFEL